MSVRESIVQYPWFFLGCLFLFINAYGVLQLTHILDKPSITAVEAKVSPGTDSIIRNRQSLSWEFPVDMVADKEVGS
jgi:hypothetical protein